MKIPEGWKLVPVEPTEEMLKAMIGWRECDPSEGLRGEAAMFECAYRCALSAAPTPPAQEDEPVAVSINGRIANLREPLPHGTELYTRPANDKLRKAAGELISTFDRIKCLESRYGPCSAIENLRAALEEK